jgi:hypothetical protein
VYVLIFVSVCMIVLTYIHYVENRLCHGLPLVKVTGPGHRLNREKYFPLANVRLTNVMFWPKFDSSRSVSDVPKDVTTAPVGSLFYAIRKVRHFYIHIPVICLFF